MYDCEVTNSSCNGKCPPGHYCEEGLKYPCPAGMFYILCFLNNTFSNKNWNLVTKNLLLD